MGYRDRQGVDAMQCRQDSNGGICEECGQPTRGSKKPLIWRRRIVRVLLGCVVLLVVAIAYAVARGMPVPDAIGSVLGICLHMLMGI